MRRIRFSIASLLVVVLFLAVALAALRESTDLWDSGLFGTTVMLLLTSVLLTVHRTGRKRAFWLGFAVFGWSYLLASLVPQVESRLATTKGLAYLDSKVPGRNPYTPVKIAVTLDSWVGPSNPPQKLVFSPNGQTLAGSTDRGMIWLWDSATGKLLAGAGGSSENFMRIGHSIAALVLAFLGACLSRSLQSTSRPAFTAKMPPGRVSGEAGRRD